MKKKLQKLILMGLIFGVLVGLTTVSMSSTEDPDPWVSEHMELFL